MLCVAPQSSERRWAKRCELALHPLGVRSAEDEDSLSTQCSKLLLDAANTLAALSVLWGATAWDLTAPAGRKRTIAGKGEYRNNRGVLFPSNKEDLDQQKELLCSSLVVCAAVHGRYGYANTSVAVWKSVDSSGGEGSAIPMTSRRVTYTSEDSEVAPSRVLQDSSRRQAVLALLSLRSVMFQETSDLKVFERLPLQTLKWLIDEVGAAVSACYRS